MNNMLLNLYVKFQDLKNSEEGQDLVEYALVVALIAFGATAGMGQPCQRHQHRVQHREHETGRLPKLVAIASRRGGIKQPGELYIAERYARQSHCRATISPAYTIRVQDDKIPTRVPHRSLNQAEMQSLLHDCIQRALSARFGKWFDMLLPSAPDNANSLLLIEGGLTAIAFAVAFAGRGSATPGSGASSISLGSWPAGRDCGCVCRLGCTCCCVWRFSRFSQFPFHLFTTISAICLRPTPSPMAGSPTRRRRCGPISKASTSPCSRPTCRCTFLGRD